MSDEHSRIPLPRGGDKSREKSPQPRAKAASLIPRDMRARGVTVAVIDSKDQSTSRIPVPQFPKPLIPESSSTTSPQRRQRRHVSIDSPERARTPERDSEHPGESSGELSVPVPSSVGQKTLKSLSAQDLTDIPRDSPQVFAKRRLSEDQEDDNADNATTQYASRAQYIPITTYIPGLSKEKKKVKEKDQAIRVCARFRPPNQMETSKSPRHLNVVQYNDDEKSVVVKTTYGEEYGYTFDRIFDGAASQREVYEYSAKPIVEDVLNGYNGTVFAYGQTASGKTHTMEGPNIDDDESKGIIPRMIETIFDYIMDAEEYLEFNLKVSYVEIYMEKIRDLLDRNPHRKPLQVREERSRGIWIEGATEIYVASIEEVLGVMREGAANRAISATKMNRDSSRSHAIFVLTVTVKNLQDLSNKGGKLYLVDLAGSEKVGKTNVSGLTLEEAKMINKSLSALGNVINSLTDGKSTHIPYRDSKLTRVLQESLGGNSRTTLITTCSPAGYNELETLSTLRFGNRAKKIKNRAKINKERSAQELTTLLEKAECEILSMMKYIAKLESVLESGGKPSLKNFSDVEVEGEAPGRDLKLPAALQSDVAMKEMEKEHDALTQQHTYLLKELQEKDQELDEQLEAYESLKQEKIDALSREEAMKQENVLLLQKLADTTFSTERMEFERNEQVLNSEALQSANKTLKEDLEAGESNLTKARKEIETLREQVSQLEDELSSARARPATDDYKSAQEEWAAREAGLKEALGALETDTVTGDAVSAADVFEGHRSCAIQADFESPDIELRAHVAQLEASLLGLRQSSESTAQDNQVLKSQCRDFKTALRQLMAERDELRIVLAKTKEEVQQQTNTPATLTSMSGDSQDSDQPDRFQQLQKACLKIERQTTRITEQDKIIDALKNEALRLRGEEKNLNDVISKKEEEMIKKETNMAELQSSYAGKLKYIEEREKEWDRYRTEAALRASEDRQKQAVIEQTQRRIKEFEQFRDALMRDLQNRCEKVVELQMVIDQNEEKFKEHLEKTEGKNLQRKNAYLERNLEQLTNIHQHLMNQNSALQLEKEMAERKITNRNQRIKTLEHLVQQAQKYTLERSQAHEQEISRYRILVRDLEQAYNSQKASRGESTTKRGHTRQASIIKSIRGGSGDTQPRGIRGGHSQDTSGKESPKNEKPSPLDVPAANPEPSETESGAMFSRPPLSPPAEYRSAQKGLTQKTLTERLIGSKMSTQSNELSAVSHLIQAERDRRLSDAAVEYRDVDVDPKSEKTDSESSDRKSSIHSVGTDGGEFPVSSTRHDASSIPGGNLWGSVGRRSTSHRRLTRIQSSSAITPPFTPKSPSNDAKRGPITTREAWVGIGQGVQPHSDAIQNLTPIKPATFPRQKSKSPTANSTETRVNPAKKFATAEAPSSASRKSVWDIFKGRGRSGSGSSAGSRSSHDLSSSERSDGKEKDSHNAPRIALPQFKIDHGSLPSRARSRTTMPQTQTPTTEPNGKRQSEDGRALTPGKLRNSRSQSSY